MMGLSLVNQLLENGYEPKRVWGIFRRLLALYRLLLEMSMTNLTLVAESQIPELLIKIIDGRQFPKDENVINEIFQLVVMYL